MLMTQQQLSQARCSTPGCDHADHPMLFLVSRCHPQAGVEACYHVQTGTLQITCNECGGYICDILVAPAEGAVKMPSLGVDHHVAEVRCPWCGALFDAATGIDTDDRPELGSYTVCIHCAGVGEFCLGPALQFELRVVPDKVWQAQPEPIPSQLRDARRAISEALRR